MPRHTRDITVCIDCSEKLVIGKNITANRVKHKKYICTPCNTKRQNLKKKKDPERFKNHELKVNFGITKSEYDKMFQAQKGLCKICKTDKCGQGIMFAVDHCHETGAIRGLLCKNCNLGLGHYLDNIDVMKKAIKYLKKHKTD